MSQQIAGELLGQIDWTDSRSGFCICPGIGMHNGPDNPKDCQVFIEGAPTIHCFHDSCASIVADANLKLRRAIGSKEAVQPFNTGQYVKKKKKEHAVSQASRKLLTRIVEQPWEPADMWEDSPYRLLGDHTHDWRLLLGIFKETDTVWIGDIKDSGSPEHSTHFRTVSHWLKSDSCPGQFTCPATFKSTSYSRSKANVLSRPFLVVESDTLSQSEIGAVFKWVNKFLELYAIVDTGGKSLHGWFKYPKNAHALETLKQILTELECDRKMFSESQPCRLPSAKRGNRFQSLLFYAPYGYGGTNH